MIQLENKTGILESKTGISELQIGILYEIFKKYQLELVKVFGSRAKGNYKPLSDLDLVIIGFGQDQIGAILEDIRESDFLYSVDILGYDDILGNKLLRLEIDTYSTNFYQPLTKNQN